MSSVFMKLTYRTVEPYQETSETGLTEIRFALGLQATKSTMSLSGSVSQLNLLCHDNPVWTITTYVQLCSMDLLAGDIANICEKYVHSLAVIVWPMCDSFGLSRCHKFKIWYISVHRSVNIKHWSIVLRCQPPILWCTKAITLRPKFALVDYT